jgi:hypothetical protein
MVYRQRLWSTDRALSGACAYVSIVPIAETGRQTQRGHHVMRLQLGEEREGGASVLLESSWKVARWRSGTAVSGHSVVCPRTVTKTLASGELPTLRRITS